MIARAIIQHVISNYLVKVRIPFLHKAEGSPSSTPNSELPEAVFCVPPNATPCPQVGDIVIVAFENNQREKPIILGYLARDINTETSLDLRALNLTATVSASLPSDTTIGEVSSSEISKLSGVKGNIQKQIDAITDKLSVIDK